MQLILKVLLLVIVLGVSLLFASGLIYSLVIQNGKFQEEYLLVFGVSVLGFLSSWFHIKTIKLYRLDKKNEVLPIPSKTFWTFNIGFATALIAFFSYTFYTAFLRFEQLTIDSPQLIRVLIIFFIPVAIGGFIFIESYYIKRLLKKNKDRKLILEIDHIKGEL